MKAPRESRTKWALEEAEVGTMRDAGSVQNSTVALSQEAARGTRKLVERRAAHRPARRPSLALAMSRLEREHVALLLAICELESPSETDGNSLVLREALLRLLREDLRQTQRALARAAQGRYGTCEGCNRLLSVRLLELLPSATTCPVCEARARRAMVD